MLKNYLQVAIRNLLRNKLYSFISVIGLSVGIASCLLIFLYVQHEVSYDRFHANAKNIYRMIQYEGQTGELAEGTTSTSALLAGVMKKDFPEVTGVTIINPFEMVIITKDKSFSQSIVHVNQDFLTMFSFPLIKGNAETALSNPNSTVITPEIAEKLFGNSDPIGKTLSIIMGETTREFTVSGIIEKAPTNSSIEYDLLVSNELLKYSIPERLLETWNIILFSTLIQVKPGTDIPALEEKISNHINRLSNAEDENKDISFKLQRLTDIHLDPKLDGIDTPAGNPVYSYILSAIAFAVLLIASINFMTLTIGRSAGRAREVGLRKVLGAHRFQIMKQFWGEAVVLCVLSVLAALALTEVFLPTFNALAQKQLTLNLLSNWAVFPALLILTLLTAFLAGAYPSLLLSKLTPVESIRGISKVKGKGRLIQAMVVLQFSIAVFLIIGALVISTQINFLKSAKLGYNKNQVITFHTGTEGEQANNMLKRFREALANQTSVVDVSGYSYPLGQSWLYINFSDKDNLIFLIGEDITGSGFSQSAGKNEGYFYTNWVDEHYIPTMDIKLVEGRNFSEEYASDGKNAIIINQTAAKMMGWYSPIGKSFNNIFRKTSVIGVIEDFHFYPLHRKIEPLVLRLPQHNDLSSINEIAVRIRADNMPATISKLENTWKEISGGMPFNYTFLDETVGKQYAEEMRWRKIIRYSSIFAILVTCLGLFGLSAMSVAKRTREIGIRKVIGASVTNIVSLLTKEFLILVAAANLIAWPLAYIIMNKWLQLFVYRTNFSVFSLLGAGVISLIAAALTVSFQSIRAASANPVDSIRYE